MGQFSGLVFARLISASILSLVVWSVEGKIAAAQPPAEQIQQPESSEVVPQPSTPAMSVFDQVQAMLQAAQALINKGNSADALVQLDQATMQAKTLLPAGESRDRLLSAIGLQLLEIKALDQAQAIAQAMTYETLGAVDLFRVELEKSLVRVYIQAQQTPQAVQLIQALKPEMRDQYWVIAIETLAQQGEASEATALLKNIVDQTYFRYVAINAITRAHISAEQFAQAQTFLAQQPYADPLDKASGLNEVALWAARANRMEEAVAIAQQIPETNRAATLISLAELCQAREQTECAVNLLATAAALPYPADDWWSWFETTRKIAVAYADWGYPDAAENALNAAEQKFPTLPDNPYPAAEWIGAFAKIGAFDRASALLAQLPEAERHESQFRIATAYTDQAQYEQAITFASKIPDRVLFPLPEYPDPKVELLNRILNETVQQEKFAIAQRAALVLQDPVDRVQALRAIATAYQSKQRSQLATETLDQALAVANTIAKHSFLVDRHSSYEVSNADLLTAIAEGYWAAGQQEKAIATLTSALQSEKAFQSDLQSPWSRFNQIKKIAQLAYEWKQPDLRQAAVAEGEAQVTTIIENPETPPEAIVEQITGLIALSYEPGVAPSETLNRHFARLETLREQAASPEQQLAILYNLVYLYNLTDQPQQVRASIEQALPLIAPLSADLRDGHYTRFALAIASEDPAGVSQLVSLLSSDQKRVEVLLEITKQFAAKDQSTQAIDSFEQAVALAQTSLSASSFESVMVALANSYTFFNTGGYYSNSGPQRTPTEKVLMSRVPQHISDPLLRARVWISFAPTEDELAYAGYQGDRRVYGNEQTLQEVFYAGLTSALAEIPNNYARRNLLWEGINEAIAAQKFAHATQLANALDGEYRQSALGLVEMARQK